MKAKIHLLSPEKKKAVIELEIEKGESIQRLMRGFLQIFHKRAEIAIDLEIDQTSETTAYLSFSSKKDIGSAMEEVANALHHRNFINSETCQQLITESNTKPKAVVPASETKQVAAVPAPERKDPRSLIEAASQGDVIAFRKFLDASLQGKDSGQLLQAALFISMNNRKFLIFNELRGRNLLSLLPENSEEKLWEQLEKILNGSPDAKSILLKEMMIVYVISFLNTPTSAAVQQEVQVHLEHWQTSVAERCKEPATITHQEEDLPISVFSSAQLNAIVQQISAKMVNERSILQTTFQEIVRANSTLIVEPKPLTLESKVLARPQETLPVSGKKPSFNFTLTDDKYLFKGSETEIASQYDAAIEESLARVRELRLHIDTADLSDHALLATQLHNLAAVILKKTNTLKDQSNPHETGQKVIEYLDEAIDKLEALSKVNKAWSEECIRILIDSLRLQHQTVKTIKLPPTKAFQISRRLCELLPQQVFEDEAEQKANEKLILNFKRNCLLDAGDCVVHFDGIFLQIQFGKNIDRTISALEEVICYAKFADQFGSALGQSLALLPLLVTRLQSISTMYISKMKQGPSAADFLQYMVNVESYLGEAISLMQTRTDLDPEFKKLWLGHCINVLTTLKKGQLSRLSTTVGNGGGGMLPDTLAQAFIKSFDTPSKSEPRSPKAIPQIPLPQTEPAQKQKFKRKKKDLEQKVADTPAAPPAEKPSLSKLFDEFKNDHAHARLLKVIKKKEKHLKQVLAHFAAEVDDEKKFADRQQAVADELVVKAVNLHTLDKPHAEMKAEKETRTDAPSVSVQVPTPILSRGNFIAEFEKKLQANADEKAREGLIPEFEQYKQLCDQDLKSLEACEFNLAMACSRLEARMTKAVSYVENKLSREMEDLEDAVKAQLRKFAEIRQRHLQEFRNHFVVFKRYDELPFFAEKVQGLRELRNTFTKIKQTLRELRAQIREWNNASRDVKFKKRSEILSALEAFKNLVNDLPGEKVIAQKYVDALNALAPKAKEFALKQMPAAEVKAASKKPGEKKEKPKFEHPKSKNPPQEFRVGKTPKTSASQAVKFELSDVPPQLVSVFESLFDDDVDEDAAELKQLEDLAEQSSLRPTAAAFTPGAIAAALGGPPAPRPVSASQSNPGLREIQTASGGGVFADGEKKSRKPKHKKSHRAEVHPVPPAPPSDGKGFVAGKR